MTTPTTTPTYWPGTTIVKSRLNAFNVARKTEAAEPQATKAKPKATPKPKGGTGGFKANNGTLHGLGSARTAKLLQPKPNLMRHKSNAAPLRPIAQASHNGAYSRAAAGKASAPTPPKGKAATTTGATTP